MSKPLSDTEKAQKMKHDQLMDDIRYTFRDKRSRKVLGWLIDQSKMFEGYDFEENAYFKLGQQSVGLKILEFVNTADPNIYIETLRGN